MKVCKGGSACLALLAILALHAKAQVPLPSCGDVYDTADFQDVGEGGYLLYVTSRAGRDHDGRRCIAYEIWNGPSRPSTPVRWTIPYSTADNRPIFNGVLPRCTDTLPCKLQRGLFRFGGEVKGPSDLGYGWDKSQYSAHPEVHLPLPDRQHLTPNQTYEATYIGKLAVGARDVLYLRLGLLVSVDSDGEPTYHVRLGHYGEASRQPQGQNGGQFVVHWSAGTSNVLAVGHLERAGSVLLPVVSPVSTRSGQKPRPNAIDLRGTVAVVVNDRMVLVASAPSMTTMRVDE